jgi:peptidoglycan/LPS O-acetylase OafA/YrhL
LESRTLVILGTLSYSLYLVHAPIVAIIFALAQGMHAGNLITFLGCELVGVPICIGIAYGFFHAFERPYLLNRRPGTERNVELAAVASPAP